MRCAVLAILLCAGFAAAEEKPKRKLTFQTVQDKKVHVEKNADGTPIVTQPKNKRARELGYMSSDLATTKAPYKARFGIIPSTHLPAGADSTDIEIFWQRPAGEVKGVMFGATGCFHQGGDFFNEQHDDGTEFEGCKYSKLSRCQGLPETVYFNRYARERGYLFMTITPAGLNSCWDHDEDPPRVHQALQHVLKVEGLPADTPMFASGASQGGYFMYDLQKYDKISNLKCIAPQCAEMKYKTGKEHLPTMLIWMPRDHNLTNPIHHDIKYLKEKMKLRVAVRTPHPWPVQTLLKERGYPDNVTEEVTYRMRHARAASGPAKGKYSHRPLTETGFIVDHPGTDSWWAHPIAKYMKAFDGDTLVKDHSKLHQLMQVAFAEHEFTAEYTDHIIDFCEDHEDANRMLRFDRKPQILKSRKFAQICSPMCPPTFTR